MSGSKIRQKERKTFLSADIIVHIKLKEIIKLAAGNIFVKRQKHQPVLFKTNAT